MVRRAGLTWYAIALVVVVADQVTKAVAVAELSDVYLVEFLPFLSWKLAYNQGAAFSMFADADGWQRWFFVLVAIGFSVYLVYEIQRLEKGQWFHGLVYALIMGGAVGNMIDRVTQGYVVDFVFVHYGWFQFPVFNVADSAVSLGAAGWIAMLINEARQREPADSQNG